MSPSTSDLADRRNQLRRSAVVGEIPQSAGFERAYCILMFLLHGKHQYVQIGIFFLKLLDEFNATFAGIDISSSSTSHASLLTVCRLTQHAQIISFRQDLFSTIPYNR